MCYKGEEKKKKKNYIYKSSQSLAQIMLFLLTYAQFINIILSFKKATIITKIRFSFIHFIQEKLQKKHHANFL